MKKKILLLLLLGCMNYVFAQKNSQGLQRQSGTGLNAQPEHLDTLYVSPGSTTYLAFPEDISLVDIGSKEYAFKVEKNILLLKSELIQGKGTNMLVKFGNDLFTGWLAHTDKPHRSLYDYRKQSRLSQANFNRARNISTGVYSAGISSSTLNSSKFPLNDLTMTSTEDSLEKNELISKHIRLMGNREDKFRTFGVVKHSMSFLLVNLMSDSLYMYMRFKVTNKSSMGYNLDYVSFESRKKGHKETRLLQAVYIPPTRQVPAHEDVLLNYAIPLYAVGEGGIYQVTFRESDGNRRAILTIPTRAIGMGGVFHDLPKTGKND